jgi:hypothetical protein
MRTCVLHMRINGTTRPAEPIDTLVRALSCPLTIDWLLMYCTFDAWCCVLARTADDIHYPLQRVSSLA